MEEVKQLRLSELIERVCIIGYLGSVLIVTVEEWDNVTGKPSCVRKAARLEINVSTGEVTMMHWIPGVMSGGYIFIDPQYVQALSFDIDLPYLKLYLKLFYGISEDIIEEEVGKNKVVELFKPAQNDQLPEGEIQMSEPIKLSPEVMTEIKNYIELQVKSSYKELENKMLKAINNLHEELVKVKKES